MARHSHREQILSEGLRVMHARGYSAASVRDIVRAAGVPQGSFTNHFASKEAFALEVLERYFEQARENLSSTLANTELAPRQRLEAYVDNAERTLRDHSMRNGCLIGNFSIEASEHSELIRARLVQIFAHLQQRVADCIREAQLAGTVSASIDAGDLANFFISSLQGAVLQAKAQRSVEPLRRFRAVMFTRLLA